MFERRDTGEPMHACTYMYVFADLSAISISSRGDYSRAASISFRACSGANTIRERRLFERGVYLVIYGMRFASAFAYDTASLINCNNCYGYTHSTL